MNENFEERSYLVREEEFNAARAFYHSVLSSIEKFTEGTVIHVQKTW
jgi:hypothetical protein